MHGITFHFLNKNYFWSNVAWKIKCFTKTIKFPTFCFGSKQSLWTQSYLYHSSILYSVLVTTVQATTLIYANGWLALKHSKLFKGFKIRARIYLVFVRFLLFNVDWKATPFNLLWRFCDSSITCLLWTSSNDEIKCIIVKMIWILP